MSHSQDDRILNSSTEPHFQDVLEKSLESPARRDVLRGAFGLASLATASGLLAVDAAAEAAELSSATTKARLGFSPVQKSLADAVVLPPGYSYQVVHATGDALDFSVPAYTNTGVETDDFTHRIGDQHDGMDLYFITEEGKYTTRDTGRALLVVNHESSAEAAFTMANGQTSNGVSGKKFDQWGQWDLGTRPELEVLKEINTHGVTVTEIRREGRSWKMVRGSEFNRHVTPQTVVAISGPKKHLADIRALMVTKKFPEGDRARGTINNCGHGRTPWGTYLACEENFYPYFSRTVGQAIDAKTQTALKRYGVQDSIPSGKNAFSQGWHTVSGTADDSRFERWDVALKGNSPRADYRQEPNTHGYLTEIDPLRPDSMPVQRVACGRFVHEAAVFATPVAGKPLVVYMGCDGRNEYIYKFVSTAAWDPKDIGRGLAAGNKYLDEGQLFAAKFNEDGSGQWLPLDIANPQISGYTKFPFANQAEVLVYARLAADAVGATPMDRPEWGAVNPANGEIYFALTNNSDRNRMPGTTNAANPRAYADPDGKKRAGNPHGHVLRFKELAASGPSRRFQWDIYVFGAEETSGAMNLSGLTRSNSFASPDGLWFSKATGICWIQTDDGSMTDKSNCMLLAAIPGRVGDGKKIAVRNDLKGQTADQETFIGAQLGEVNLRRFLVAPLGAEVTGLVETPDGKAIFVNIQHPGENTKPDQMAKGQFESSWPGNAGYGPNTGRPRSATIVITRDDGGVIGIA